MKNNTHKKIFWVAILSFLLVSCGDNGIPPNARLATFPSMGDSTILFELNASESSDERFYHVSLIYRWDFNVDRVWDTEFSDEPILLRYFPVPGTYQISVEVMNPDGQSSIASDTIVVNGRNQYVSKLTDPRDGQTYGIVKLNGRWWMAESLQYGIVVDPLNQGFRNNNVVERLVTKDCYRSGSYSVYSWYEALNYDLNDNHGICPDGWHIPTIKEWQSLSLNYPARYIGIYLGENGLSGINLQYGEYVSIDQMNKMIWCNTNLSSY